MGDDIDMSRRSFLTEEDFINTFRLYIQKCEKKTKKKKPKFPNVAGFCVFCDINRDTFYAQKEYYSDTFKKINDILENATINSDAASDTFKIFYLKNKFGYRDKIENVNVETSYEDYLKRVDGDVY